MLKAKLDSVRKNKKGFSLVELIIVVAIMVALIAVLAPSYVKYVNKSRDAALQTAAEDLATAIKTSYGDPDSTLKAPSDELTITVKIVDKKLNLTLTGGDNVTEAELIALGGIDTSKNMNVGTENLAFTIKVGTDKSVQGPTKGTASGN